MKLIKYTHCFKAILISLVILQLPPFSLKAQLWIELNEDLDHVTDIVKKDGMLWMVTKKSQDEIVA